MDEIKLWKIDGGGALSPLGAMQQLENELALEDLLTQRTPSPTSRQKQISSESHQKLGAVPGHVADVAKRHEHLS